MTSKLLTRAASSLLAILLGSAAASSSQLPATSASFPSDMLVAQANSIAELAPEPVAAALTEPYFWSALKSADGTTRFSGNVPAQALQRFLSVRGGVVEDDTTIRDDAPEGFSSDVLIALNILAQLTEGEIIFDGDAWSVKGRAAADADIDAVLGADTDWNVAVTPAEAVAPIVRPEPTPAVNAQAADAPADIARCNDRLAELSAHNAILFQSGAAIIAESAGAELDAFAQALALCPNSTINVEGHTDSDGEAQKNLTLSVARAEAVIRALVTRGVSPDRIYAIGYGESQPVADNATADGKRQNRRIVVSVRAADAD